MKFSLNQLIILNITMTLAAGPAAAQTLLWDTDSTQPPDTIPGALSQSQRTIDSEGTIFLDTEVADDFLIQGMITQIIAPGYNSGFRNQVEGVFVRFYEWTEDGPGELQTEYFLDGDNPAFVHDPNDPHILNITLPKPFEASGWHFLATQLVLSQGAWFPLHANPNDTVNSIAYFRDNLKNGEWAQDEFFGNPQFLDFQVQISGFAAPLIQSFEITGQPTPSGRVIINGSAFGNDLDDPTVLFDGLEAIITQNFSSELHVYIPEDVSLGTVDVQIITEGGESNIQQIEIVPRQPDGRVKWQFQTDRWHITAQNIKVGPDGRIYTSDPIGLYALSPDGALLWFTPGVGGGYPIDIGPDGTLYTGPVLSGPPCAIYAINPDNGEIEWTFDCPTNNLTLEHGPNVGPDGNIYAVQGNFPGEDDGLGMFSLDAEGDLRWSNDGEPGFTVPNSSTNRSEVVFASDRLYVGHLGIGSGQPVTWAFDFDGDQLWFTGNSDLDLFFFSYPRVDPVGRAIAVWGQVGLISLEPDGDTHFIAGGQGIGNVIIPTVDSLGNIYTAAQFGGELWSVDEDGDNRYVNDDGPGGITKSIGVSPDDVTLVLGGLFTFGQPGFIRGYNSTDGDFLWEIVLEDEQGTQQNIRNRYPVFSADSTTAYHTTSFNNVNLIDYGYLYAIDITEEDDDRILGDLNNDGVVDGSDLGIMLGAFGLNNPNADLNDDGTVDGADLGILLGAWIG